MNIKGMNKSKYTFGIFTLIVLLQFSCAPKRDLVYFSDLGTTSDFNATISNNAEPKIQSGDILGITVSSLNPESNALFNVGQANIKSQVSSANSDGYQISKFGEINFPIVGKLKLAGFTRDQAIEALTLEIEKYIKNPIVNLRFLNFKITVVGEVNRPSSFTVPNEKINLIEALGLAGDMTVYGKRENVLIIREENGSRSMARVNLNDKQVLNSPYFYLKQNDMVYVEPVKEKAALTSTSNRAIPIIVGITSIIAIILSRFKF
ncbi:MAG: polysaccharide biosynthesis/export family protein [Sphingobacteriaceae bacterium]